MQDREIEIFHLLVITHPTLVESARVLNDVGLAYFALAEAKKYRRGKLMLPVTDRVEILCAFALNPIEI